MSLPLFLILCLIGTIVIHLLYLFLYIRPLSRRFSSLPNSPEENLLTEELAIIVAAHNEEGNISELLDNLVQQTYLDFQIHVIDDYSRDKTAEIIREYQKKYPIIFYHHNALPQGKKYALRYGIESIDRPLLLFTDADCIPNSPNWATSMVNALGAKEICLGYGKYRTQNGLLNAFIQFETGMIASQYMAFAVRRKPYMGVGRNLIYRRELFIKSDRFESHTDIRSGDDDLFIIGNATKTNTTINPHSDSFTISEPPITFSQLFRQKRRHLSTSTRYPFPTQVRLATISLSKMYFHLIAIILIVFYPSLFMEVIALLLLKWFIEMTYYRHVFKKLEIIHIFYLYPLLDIALSLYYFILAPFLIFRKTDSW